MRPLAKIVVMLFAGLWIQHSNVDGALLIDFGSSEQKNVYNTADFPGWNTVLNYNAEYSDIGPEGLLTTHSNSAYINYGIQGINQTFQNRNKIIVTWFNNGNNDIVVVPEISFTETSYYLSQKPPENWYGMSRTVIPPKSSSTSVFEFDKYTEGVYQIINIRPHAGSSNDAFKDLILDKIEICDSDVDGDLFRSYARETRTITTHIYTGNGSLAPGPEAANMVEVLKGENQIFTINMGAGMTNYNVIVDGVNVNDQIVNNTFTFEDVQQDHYIAVGFLDDSKPTVNLEISHGINGTMAPTGTIKMNQGEDAHIKYIPRRWYVYDNGFDKLLLNGASHPADTYHFVASLSSYWFKSVQEDQTLHANFEHSMNQYYRSKEDLHLWKTGASAPAGSVNPDSVSYIGAFKATSGNFSGSWAEPNAALAYYPAGDISNQDSFPGSLYVGGTYIHDWITEISIPEPINTRNLNELNVAQTIQPFNQPLGTTNCEEFYGLHYIFSQDKLYFGTGKNSYWSDKNPSIGSISLDLNQSNVNGMWRLGGLGETGKLYFGEAPEDDALPLGETGWIMFDLPTDKAFEFGDVNKTLVTGRAVTKTGGPHLFAIAPWDQNSVVAEEWDYQAQEPVNNGRMKYIRLLDYDDFDGKRPIDAAWGDIYTEAAWIQNSNNNSLIFLSVMGYGMSFYNNGAGKVNWNDVGNPVLQFYDPNDISAVANGIMKPYEPKPYAYLDIKPFLYHSYATKSVYDGPCRSAACRPLGMTYDNQRNLLYIIENDVFETTGGTFPIIHVFQIGTPNNNKDEGDNDMIRCFIKEIFIE